MFDQSEPHYFEQMKLQIFTIIFTCFFFMGCESLHQVANTVLTEATSTEKSLTNDEVIAGLKQALELGTNNASSITSKLDGFLKNDRIRLPFPEDAIKVREKMLELGLNSQVEKFETTLNRAAEEASKEAAPIFVNAIKEMTIADGFTILKGSDNAATQYLQDKTSNQLASAFQPKVKDAISKVELTKYWNPIITKYNTLAKFTGGNEINSDLEQYITQKAIAGLFVMLADEESKIRKDPIARVTDVLKRVFGSLD